MSRGLQGVGTNEPANGSTKKDPLGSGYKMRSEHSLGHLLNSMIGVTGNADTSKNQTSLK